MGSGFSVTAGTGIREFEVALRQGLAGTYTHRDDALAAAGRG